VSDILGSPDVTRELNCPKPVTSTSEWSFAILDFRKRISFASLRKLAAKQLPMHRFMLRIGFLGILGVCLTSCVATSDWLSHSSPSQHASLNRSHSLAPIQIGTTTKEEIVASYGNPVDQQRHSMDGRRIESFGYSTTETPIKPYQYIPIVGALAFGKSLTHQNPSWAISFSPQDRVSGLTISDTNAYGDIPSTEIFSMPDSSPSFYGMRNPDVFHAQPDSGRSRP